MSGIKPLSVLSLLAAAILALSATPDRAIAQEESEEVDCKSVCRVFPDRAPPECECDQVAAGVSAPFSDRASYADPLVREIVEEMEEHWREATANVEDYTVVQTSSVVTEDGLMPLGPPVVIHFEEEWIEGYPMYRMVSPAELSNMEQEARGEPTAGEVGTAMGQAIDLLAGAAAGAAGAAMGPGAGGVGGALPGLSLPEGLGSELRELRDLLSNLDEAAETETRQDLADELYHRMWVFAQANVPDRTAPWKPCNPSGGGYVRTDGSDYGSHTDVCATIVATRSDLERASTRWDGMDGPIAPGALPGDYEGYEIEEIEAVIAKPADRDRFCKCVSLWKMRTQLVSPRGETVVLTRELFDYHKIVVNDGPPTREQIAQLIAEVWGESGAPAGFPRS